MAAIDISQLSGDELRTLGAEIAARIQQIEAEAREAGLRKIEEIAATHGLSAREIAERFGRGRRRRKPAAPPMYRNPENPEQTWTGRGRKPSWVLDYESRGCDLEVAKIQ